MTIGLDIKNVFISALPGIGKTTLIKELTLSVREHVGGFYTEEIIKDGGRFGFLLKTFDGQETVFASRDIKTGPKISKYRVDTDALERVGLAAVRAALKTNKIVVIDEIGSMEILSASFGGVFAECLAAPNRMLATIRARSRPISDQIDRLSNSTMIELTRERFPSVKEQVRSWLERCVHGGS